MAIDTELKRRAAFNYGMPFVINFPAPDGVISEDDRRMLVGCYPGITSQGGVISYDTTYQSIINGIIIGGHCYMPGDATFSMGQFVGDATPSPRWGVFGTGNVSTSDSTLDPAIILYDRTYCNGILDGTTYRDGTYTIRTFDPQWINYSIWYMEPPDKSDSVMIGYRYREPVRKNVGRYYASMEMPDQPGYYEIRWLEQKYDNTSAWEIRQEFVIEGSGITPFPDYS